MTRVAPRGWRIRASYSASPEGDYQAACGHYVAAGTYACVDCNLAPLSDLNAVREALADLVDAIERGTPDDINRSLSRSRRALEAID
jgi:hypothetical protein